MEASPQVLTIFPLLCRQEEILQRLALLREDVSVHGAHVVNTACTFLPEVVDKQISLLIRYIFYHSLIFEEVNP